MAVRSAFAFAAACAVAGAEEIHKRPDFAPDPASVQRCGAAYRYPQCGWIVVHIEGAPYERGFQYGKLLAGEIAEFLAHLGRYYGPKDPEAGYRQLRQSAQALFLPKYDAEWLEEMKGIADGAADAGAKLGDRKVDLIDLVALNSYVEFDFLGAALKRTPTGLEGRKFPPPNGAPAPPAREHCSAFIATAPATADGKIVFGHITMWNLEQARFFNVWLDVKPARGQRCAFQTIPGGIMSGMDYYYNSAGIVLAETTIGQTPFAGDGLTLASRCRSAIQYGASVDEVVKLLSERNNGLYTNEWLLGDTKTNEIAMFEMGTRKSKLWRSSRGEWPGGTPGFYWGCNNTKDAAVRLEGHEEDLTERAASDPTFRPSARDADWLGLFGLRKGTIGVAFGFEAFTAPRLAARTSLDAKFATADQVARMSTWAVFGPPRGGTWKREERKGDERPLHPNDWTVLAPASPPPASGAPAVDLAPLWSRKRADEPGDEEQAAWKGSPLPASDADTWLAAGWPRAQRFAALEHSLAAEKKDGQFNPAARQRLARARFRLESARYAAARRAGQVPALAEYRMRFDDPAGHEFVAARGAEFLLQLRSLVGAPAFDKAANAFGAAHAGKPATAAAFRAALEAAANRPLGDEFDRWLRGAGAPDAKPEANRWSVGSFHAEPGKTLVVYGTLGDAVAQREAAHGLVAKLRENAGDAVPKELPDDKADEARCRGRHLLVVGRPATNRLAKQWADKLPARFGSGSFVLADQTYANEETGVLLALPNPYDARYSAVLVAGLGVNATTRAAGQLTRGADLSGEALLLEAGQAPRPLVLRQD